MNFHCSLSSCTKELSRFMFMSTIDYVDFHCSFRVVVKTYVVFYLCGLLLWKCSHYVDFFENLCQLWIIWTSIAVLGLVVKNLIKFGLCQFSLQFSGCSKESYRFSSMSTMDYMDFHCSFRDYNIELYRFLFMWTFIAVLLVVVKNHIDFCLCELSLHFWGLL